jgi:copper transport protein
VIAVLMVVAFALLPAPPAAAHPTLRATAPPAGYSVVEAPREITLDFGEPVGLVGEAVQLTAGDGRAVRTAPATLSENGRRVTAQVEEDLAAEVYRVAWQVRGQDGDLVSGGFSFAVGMSALDGAGALAPTDGGGGADGGNVSAAVLRWALFAALALGLGGVAGTLLAGRIRREPGGAELAPVPAPLLAAAVVGLTATAGLLAVGGYGIAEVLGSRPGRLLGVELAAFAATAGLAGLARLLPRPALRAAAVVPLLAVVVAEALRAHPAELRPLAGGLLTAVHLLAAAL